MVRFLSEYFFASTIARCLGGQLQDGELGDAQALAVMADITKAMRSRADASGTLSSTVSSLQRVWRAASPGERMLLPTLPRDDETKTGARAVAWAWGGWLEPPARDILLKYLSGVPGFIYRLSFVDPEHPPSFVRCQDVMQLVERFNRVWSGYARHVAERNPDHRVAVRFAVPHDSLVVLRERIPGVRFESEAGAVPGDVPLATWSMPIESYVALIDVLGNDLLDLLRSSTQDASS